MNDFFPVCLVAYVVKFDVSVNVALDDGAGGQPYVRFHLVCLVNLVD